MSDIEPRRLSLSLSLSLSLFLPNERTNFRGLFEDDDAEFLARLCGQLLQLDRSRQPGLVRTEVGGSELSCPVQVQVPSETTHRSTADNEHIDFILKPLFVETRQDFVLFRCFSLCGVRPTQGSRGKRTPARNQNDAFPTASIAPRNVGIAISRLGLNSHSISRWLYLCCNRTETEADTAET